MQPHRRGRPGWVLRFTRDDKRRQDPPRACIGSSGTRLRSGQAERQGACAAPAAAV